MVFELIVLIYIALSEGKIKYSIYSTSQIVQKTDFGEILRDFCEELSLKLLQNFQLIKS